VEAAGGLIIQLLPDHTEETICRIENNISTFGTFTFLMKRGMTLEQILQRILTGFEITPLTDVKPLSFALQVLKRAICGSPKSTAEQRNYFYGRRRRAGGRALSVLQ
jgi:hypothetical protein